jgi:hypothetical protein
MPACAAAARFSQSPLKKAQSPAIEPTFLPLWMMLFAGSGRADESHLLPCRRFFPPIASAVLPDRQPAPAHVALTRRKM